MSKCSNVEMSKCRNTFSNVVICRKCRAHILVETPEKNQITHHRQPMKYSLIAALGFACVGTAFQIPSKTRPLLPTSAPLKEFHFPLSKNSLIDSRFEKNQVQNTFLQLQQDSSLVGEDAAQFSLGDQSLKSWGIFGAAVATVLSFVFYVWIWDNGLQWGEVFKETMENLAQQDSTLAITYMLAFFAVAHSGLASLRPLGEEVIGARAWRVLFALVSLPLAFSSIVYFINHRYDGIQLWDLRLEPGMHDFVWWTSLLSFFFLYPSTFNLLEVAAVDKPQLHLWETGISRITRHPQMVGQLTWCLAHTAYIGTSFMCATSAMLCLHHLFAVWNGDRRLREKWGERADIVIERTSVIPFAAILSGKQQLPEKYYEEFLRLPYLTIIVGSVIAYYAHPFMQGGAALLKW